MTAVQRKYGPTGPTGPQGPLGPSVTGPTGPSGLDEFTVNLTSTSIVAINTFDKNAYAMASYVVRAKQGTDAIASDFKVLHNGTDIDYVEYASLSIGTLEIFFSADVVGDNVVLFAQCATASSGAPVEIKIIRTKF